MSPLKATREWHVYALKDPRDGAVRYVGATYNPKQRLQGHLSDRTGPPKCAWIADLQDRGLAPEMCVLESGNTDPREQAACEQRWIDRFRPSGGLLNVVGTTRERVVERIQEGLAKARLRGDIGGRPTLGCDWNEVDRLHKGGMSMRDIGDKLNISAASICRHLKTVRAAGVSEFPETGSKAA